VINCVRVSREAFLWKGDDSVSFVFATNQRLSRAAVADYLKQRGSHHHYDTPYKLGKYVEQSVHLAVVPVPRCSNGCMAFPHLDTEVRMCVHCGANIFKAGNIPALTTPYRPITPWLRLMFADRQMSACIK